MTDTPTTLERLTRLDWRRYATWAAAIAIVWPTQYTIAAPIVTLAAGAWAVLKAAAKIGFWGLFLLVVPIVGWLVLALILQGRRKERNAERRHLELLAATTGESVTLPAPTEPPLWRTIWSPWMTSRLTPTETDKLELSPKDAARLRGQDIW